MEWYLAVLPEEVATIYLIAGEVDGKVDCKLKDLSGGLDLSSGESNCFDYSRFWETCLVLKVSVPSSVADLFQMTIGRTEAMRRASILAVLVSALESTLASSSYPVREAKEQLASRSPEQVAALENFP